MPSTPVFQSDKLDVGERLDGRFPFGFGPDPDNSKILDDQFSKVDWIRREIKSAEDHVLAFRANAREACAFVAGDQLDRAVRQEFKARGKPDTAFNGVQRFVRRIAGLERRSPQTLLCTPNIIESEIQSAFGDFLTQAYDWVMRQCMGHFERSRAFEDMIKTGMGWTDCFLDRQRDPKGLVRLKRVPWDEMLWPDCGDENLSTTRWRCRESLIDKSDALLRWKDFAQEIHTAASAKSAFALPVAASQVVYTVDYIETENQDIKWSTMPEKKGKVCVSEFQWFEDEEGYSFQDPVTQQDTWLSTSDYRSYQRRLELFAPKVRLLRQPNTKRVYRVAYLLDRKTMLGEPTRLPGDRFRFNCMTGHWDEDKRQWYGFVRILIDPQKYANTFFRQLLEINSTTAKGGVMAEKDAFDDDSMREEFTTEFARPDGVPIVSSGALKEGKVLPKPVGQIPPTTMGILEFCTRAMDEVTGLNTAAELQAEQSGTTMRQRQHAQTVVLANEFDSLSRYRLEDEGPVVFEHLKLIADNKRMVQLGGQEALKVMPLFKQPFSVEYELMLDDTENDPNMRQQYAAMMMEAGPFLSRQGLFVPEMWWYMPWPFKVKRMLIGAMKAQTEAAQQAAAQGINLHGRGTPRDPNETAARIADITARAELHKAKAQNLANRSQQETAQTLVDEMNARRQASLEADRTQVDRERLAVDREKLVLDHHKAKAKTIVEMMKAMSQRGNGGQSPRDE